MFKTFPQIPSYDFGINRYYEGTGRLLPVAQQVPREQRLCVFCASGSAEDEHHQTLTLLLLLSHSQSSSRTSTLVVFQARRSLAG